MLATIVALLAAAVVAVPLTRRGGFGSVLGYLLAGVAIGPTGLRLVTDVHQIAEIASLGVVMLLFLIGLEVRPRRLWVMRRTVLGLGAAQVVGTTAVLALIIHAVGLSWPGAIVLGAGLAMSSTAIVLPMLAERDLLQSRAGRDGFAVLLFQDMAFIPLVALVPLLAGQGMATDQLPWQSVGLGVLTIAAILVGGRFLLPPLFRAVSALRTPEVFTVTALLVVAGAAFLCEVVGLSASLGAFMAGVLLSESEYRHEVEADIAPFEGLLLGFFFISVGMSADLGLLAAKPGLLIGGTIVLVAVKALVCLGLASVMRRDGADQVRFSLSLSQASEFSFVLFAAAAAAGILSADNLAATTLIVAASMIATPILFAGSEKFLLPRLTKPAEPVFDPIENESHPVIICGFGRVGQIIGRVLRMHAIPFTALERDPGQVEVIRRFGGKVYFGDPTRPDLLRSAGAEQARLLIVALDDMEATLRVVDTARRHFPNLRILARARNRRAAHLLMDRSVDGLVRDTFHSSLRLAELGLRELGVDPAAAARAITLFGAHDEKMLAETHAIYRDEKQLVQSAQQATEELEALFEADHRAETVADHSRMHVPERR